MCFVAFPAFAVSGWWLEVSSLVLSRALTSIFAPELAWSAISVLLVQWAFSFPVTSLVALSAF